MQIELGERLAQAGVDLDLSRVRVHTSSMADDLCRQVGARAFASGYHVVFRAGLYQPASRTGLELLVHELVHVSQFEAGRVNPGGAGAGAAPVFRDPTLEGESRAVAAAVGREGATYSGGAPEGSALSSSSAEFGPVQLDADYANSRVWRDWEDASVPAVRVDVSACGVTIAGGDLCVSRDNRRAISSQYDYFRRQLRDGYEKLVPLQRRAGDPTAQVRAKLEEQEIQLGELLLALNSGCLRSSVANVVCLAERYAAIERATNDLRNGVVRRGEMMVGALQFTKVMSSVLFTAMATVAVPASAPMLTLALTEAQAAVGVAGSAATGDREGVITGVTEALLAPLTSLADICGLKGASQLLVSLSSAVISAMITTLVEEHAHRRPRGMSERAWKRRIWRKCVAAGFAAGISSGAAAGFGKVLGSAPDGASEREQVAWNWLAGFYAEATSRGLAATADAASEEPEPAQEPDNGDERVCDENRPEAGHVQRQASGRGARGRTAARVRAQAATGVSGARTSLPYRETLQPLFGAVDLSVVSAHVGGVAAESCEAIGAAAYAMDEHVAFASTPSLRLVAHEVAHVVQQRQGLTLPGGVGSEGDTHELHADRVADHVVSGKPVESLFGTTGAPAAAVGIVQRVEDTNLEDPAGPQSDAREPASETGSQGPSEEELRSVPEQHVIFEQLAHRFAYCDEATIRRDPDLASFGYELAAYFDDTVTGLRVMRFEPRRVAPGERGAHRVPVVAFRGTELGFGTIPGAELRVDDLGSADIGQHQFDHGEPDILELLLGSSQPPVVVGHSLGGALAQRAAIRYPNLISEVVTFQAPGIGEAEQEVRGGPMTAPADEKCRDTRTPDSTHYSVAGDVVDDAGERFTRGKRVHIDYRGVNTPRSHLSYPLANIENQRGGALRPHLRDSAGARLTRGEVSDIDRRSSEGRPSELAEGARSHAAEIIGLPISPGGVVLSRVAGHPIAFDGSEKAYVEAWERACDYVADGQSVEQALRIARVYERVHAGELTEEQRVTLEQNLTRWRALVLGHLGTPARQAGRRFPTLPVVRP